MASTSVIWRGLGFTSFVLLTAYGCDRPDPSELSHQVNGQDGCPPGQSATPPDTGDGGNAGPLASELDERQLDYSEALRTASLKLIGNVPNLDDIYALADEPEASRADKYAAMIDAMLADPRFAMRMVEYWRGVFKMYGDSLSPTTEPSRETAPIFAARIMVEGRPWTDMVLASSDTCPTFDAQTGAFTSGECGNQITPAGILTDPGVHSLYYGNMAFRRARFFHEVFLCRGANAPGGLEPTDKPSTVGPCGEGSPPSNYNSPWGMDSISGSCDNASGVNFHEYNTTVVCANCHGTLNHRSPLYANFDQAGVFQATPQVPVPVAGSPLATRVDWLPPSETTAWKFGMDAATIHEMGQQMAKDPEVLSCAVKRVWNYAMSRGDIIESDAPVPERVVEPYVASFTNDQHNMKAVLRAILLSDDFVRF